MSTNWLLNTSDLELFLKDTTRQKSQKVKADSYS